MILPIYIRLPLMPFRILGILLFVMPFVALLLSGFDDEGCKIMEWIMNYGNKVDWEE